MPHRQDPKNPFKKETELLGQEPSIFQRETEIPGFPSLAALLKEDAPPPSVIQDLISSIFPEPDLRIPFKDRLTLDQVMGIIAEDTSPFPLVLGADLTRTPVDPNLVIERPTGLESISPTGIRPLKGPIGTGVIGGTVRGAMNITEALEANPVTTIASFVTAPALIAFQGMREFVGTAAIPDILDTREGIELLQDKFVEITGEMIMASPKMSSREQEEARRAFQGLLASVVVGGVLFRGIGGPAFQVARQLGAEKATALKQAKFIRAKTTAVASLGVFGAAAGEPSEREKNFVMFALATIPLGLTFSAFKAIGKTDTPKINDSRRAVDYEQQRAARPFEQETTPVPEVRVTREEGVVGEIKSEYIRGLERLVEIAEQDARIIKAETDKARKSLEEIAREFKKEEEVEGEVVGRIGPEFPEEFLTSELLREVTEQNRRVIEAKEGEVVGEVSPKKRKIEPIDIADVTEEHSSRIEAGEGLPAVRAPNGEIFTRRTPAEHGDLIAFAQETGADFAVREFESGWILDGKFVGLEHFQLSADMGVKAAKIVADLGPPKEPKPLEPEILASRLENYVQSEGDVTKIIIQNLETTESRMVVVPGAGLPGRALSLARELHGKDAITAVHIRLDGRFDVAVGREGSLLDNAINLKQFTEEGFITGQEISANGKNLIYVGKSGDQSFVRVPGNPRLVKIDTKDIRRPKDVNVRTQIPVPTAEKQLEGVITPEEIKVFKQLRDEIHPTEPSTEPRTFDQIRDIASTNGLELTRTASNTFIVRDRATGAELFRGATKEDAEAFINNSGQDKTVVFDGNIPIDTDVPGNVTPPPSPGLRVNEPFDFPPNTSVGSMVDLFQSLTPFIAPFKDWTAAVDNVLGTRMFSEVYLRTQEPHGRSLARSLPWLRKLQSNIEKPLLDAKIPKNRWELITDYVETMSREEMLGDPKKGKGLFINRRVNANEKSASDLLIELDIGTHRLYEFIRLREQLFDVEARSQKVKELDTASKEKIIAEITESMPLSERAPITAGVQIFDFIRTQDLNDISLYAVSRLTEAKRTGSLSRSDFAAKNEMTALEMDVARRVESIYSEVAKLPDVPISDAQLIRGYTAHFAEHQTMVPEQSLLNQRGTSRELRFVNELIRSGEINAYDRNPVSSLARYIKNAFNSVEFNDAWNSARRYIDTELGGQFGRDGSLASWVAKSYLTDLRGIPSASTKFTQRAVDSFFKKMGWKMELNIRKDLVNTYLAMANAAFMGARPGLALRDLMQLSIFHYSRFGGVGGKRTMRALELATKLGQEGTKELRDAGELPTIGIVEFETAAQLEASAVGKTMGRLPAMTRRIAETGLTLSGQRNAYEFGYKGVLLETRETAGREINRLVFGEITKEKAYKNIGLDTYNLQTKKAFDQFVTAGEYERAANFLGQQTAREIMGVYGRANHPWGWGTNLGRLMSHFGTWSSNALAFTMGGISRGNRRQRLAFATRFGMTQAGLLAASNAVGINIHSWLTIPGLFFTGGPAAQTAMLIGTALTGYGNDRDIARRRLMQLFPASNDPRSMFIPGSYVVGDWLQAINNADNPIEFFARGFSIPLKRGRSWLDDF